VLGQKFGWIPGQVEGAVARVTRIAAVVEPSETVQFVRADPADDRVLEAARAFDADVIVSGDRHLLDLGTWSEIEIISPAEFIARLMAATLADSHRDADQSELRLGQGSGDESAADRVVGRASPGVRFTVSASSRPRLREKGFAAIDEEPGPDCPIEGELPLELGLALGPSTGTDLLLCCALAEGGLPGRASAVEPRVGGMAESVCMDTRGLHVRGAASQTVRTRKSRMTPICRTSSSTTNEA